MIFRLPQSSGVPLYVQLMEQVKHAVETGALREGDQLPTIRQVAAELVMNPNTVVRAYRELEYEGIVEVKHGTGAFIKESSGARARVLRQAQSMAKAAVERLVSLGLTEDELRRVLENELAQTTAARRLGKAAEGKA